MSRYPLLAAALAVPFIGWSVPSEAQTQRAHSRAPQISRPVEPYPDQRSRAPNPYSVAPGYGGTITATTPNEWGNLGGPGTGGGGGGSP